MADYAVLNVLEEDGDGDTVFVTFQSATKTPGLHRSGFGAKFLRRQGIPAFHFIPAHNLWYQHREVVTACAAVAERIRAFKRVVTYGSSMGGYAALNFARLLGATDIICISPQFSINPAIVPFESRYLRAHEKLPRYIHDEASDFPSCAQALVVYDPRNPLDSRHADLIANAGGKKVPLRFSSHPVTEVLSIDSLNQFVLDVAHCGAAASVQPLLQRYRADRKGSWRYHFNLARHFSRSSTEKRIRLAERAITLAPDNPDAHHMLGNLKLHKSPASAINHFEESLRLRPDFYPAYLSLAKAHLTTGNREAAKSLVEMVKATKPNFPGLAEIEARVGGG